MDYLNTLSDSDSESDIADLDREKQSISLPLTRADCADKMISNLEDDIRTKCQVVVVKGSTQYSPYDMPRLEVADCIKPFLVKNIIHSDLPDIRMIFPPDPRAVRFKKRNDPNCLMNLSCMRYLPHTMTFALQAHLHEMAMPDFGAPSSGDGNDFEELDSNMDTDSSVSTLSSKDYMSELLKSEEKPKHSREQADSLLGEPSQVQSVPRQMQKPLNQPRNKKKNHRSRPVQPQNKPQNHQSQPHCEPVVCDNFASAQQKKRALKKEQKNSQKQQRKRKNRN